MKNRNDNSLNLPGTTNGGIAPIWVETEAYSAVTTGTTSEVLAVWCKQAGELAIIFPGGSEAATRSYQDGDMFAFANGGATVTVNSGMFSFVVDD